jgi:hypothetical protein
MFQKGMRKTTKYIIQDCRLPVVKPGASEQIYEVVLLIA